MRLQSQLPSYTSLGSWAENCIAAHMNLMLSRGSRPALNDTTTFADLNSWSPLFRFFCLHLTIYCLERQEREGTVDGEGVTHLNLSQIHTRYVNCITRQDVDIKPWITFSYNTFSHTSSVALELAMKYSIVKPSAILSFLLATQRAHFLHWHWPLALEVHFALQTHSIGK